MNTTSMIETKLTTVDCVSRLLESNLRFRVSVTLDQAEEILSKFSPYNSIPHSISSLPATIKRVIGPVKYAMVNGLPNPNNGKYHNIVVSIGNEGSLVIYIEVRFSGTQEKNPKCIEAALQSIGDSFAADENDIVDRNDYSVTARLWWD